MRRATTRLRVDWPVCPLHSGRTADAPVLLQDLRTSFLVGGDVKRSGTTLRPRALNAWRGPYPYRWCRWALSGKLQPSSAGTGLMNVAARLPSRYAPSAPFQLRQVPLVAVPGKHHRGLRGGPVPGLIEQPHHRARVDREHRFLRRRRGGEPLPLLGRMSPHGLLSCACRCGRIGGTGSPCRGSTRSIDIVHVYR